jgi:hypothetical protein
MTQSYPKTSEEAIFQIYSQMVSFSSRMTSLETTLRGTPNTQEGGLVQAVQEIKDLAVEVKDKNILQGESLTWLTTRCRAFHGERNDIDKATESKAAGLASVSKNRLIAFLLAAGTVIAAAIYQLGIQVGWWIKPPP